MWSAYLAALVVVVALIVWVNSRPMPVPPTAQLKTERVPIEWWTFAVTRATYYKRALKSAVFQARRQARRAERAERMLNSMFEPASQTTIRIPCTIGVRDELRAYTTDTGHLVIVTEEDGSIGGVTLDDDTLKQLVGYLLPYVGGLPKRKDRAAV